MLLEGEQVEFPKGAVQRARPQVFLNYHEENLERPGLAVPLRRDGSMLWRVDAPPGSTFATDVARLNPGNDRDETPCMLRVTVVGANTGEPGPAADAGADSAPAVASARPDPLVTHVQLPAYPQGHSDVKGPWREGPATRLTLPLPDGARELRIEVISQGQAPKRSAVALIDPHLDEPRRSVAWEQAPLVFARVQRLLGRVVSCEPGERQRFALRRDADGSEGVIDVCPQEAMANFRGHEARPALALLEEHVATFVVDVEPGSVLRAAVALDERVPADARGRLVLRVDGAPLGELDFGTVWRDFELPLEAHVGHARVLTLSVSRQSWQPAWSTRSVVDPVSYAPVQVDFLAERLRAGIADPRIETATAVTRRASSPARPNVIVLHIETLRADFLALWGGVVPGLTPNLDRLAERSVVFDNAISSSSWTLPSTVTLLTGLPPSAHGVVQTGRSLVPPDTPTFAERAREHGIVTAALVANNLLTIEGGYARGFSTFGEPHHANAEQVLHLAKAHLRTHAGQQMLMWLHLMDPHYPYLAPGAWRDRYVAPELAGVDASGALNRLKDALRHGVPVSPDDPDVRICVQRYLGEIAYLDERIGALLDELEQLGLADETAFVITADHGEEFFEHGMIGHGTELFDETVRVPLIVFDPAGRLGAARRVPGVVSTAGLFATVLELLDVPYERDDVRPSLMPGRPEPFAFTETNQGLVQDGAQELLSRFVTAVRTEDALLIWRAAVEQGAPPEEELYDLRSDPGAQRPQRLTGETYERLREMMNASLGWSAARRAANPVTGVDIEWLQALRSIGYVDGG